MLAKGFLTDNLGHTFLIDTRIEPLSAQKKKNLENHNLTGGLVFKFPVLFTALLGKQCCVTSHVSPLVAYTQTCTAVTVLARYLSAGTVFSNPALHSLVGQAVT